MPTDEELLAFIRSHNHRPYPNQPVDGMVMCHGDCAYYVPDPRDDPDFDGVLRPELIRPWGLI